MTIQAFIEKAIKGGWKLAPYYRGKKLTREDIIRVAQFQLEQYGKHEILLDPDAWRAVGKVEGWNDAEEKRKYPMYRKHPDGAVTLEENQEAPDWLIAMHRMIDSLAGGKSIDEYLETL